SPSILQSASFATRSARESTSSPFVASSVSSASNGSERFTPITWTAYTLPLFFLAIPHANITASKLAGEPSTGTRMERTPAVGSDAAKLNDSPRVSDARCGASRHYRNAPHERQRRHARINGLI